jgi:hypothetical protein
MYVQCGRDDHIHYIHYTYLTCWYFVSAHTTHFVCNASDADGLLMSYSTLSEDSQEGLAPHRFTLKRFGPRGAESWLFPSRSRVGAAATRFCFKAII